MKIRVGVIFGGESVEHEVSIISANQALKALDEDKYEIIPIYISKDKTWYTGELLKEIKNYRNIKELIKKSTPVQMVLDKNKKVILQKNTGSKRKVTELDIMFPVIHGTNGEDGTLQGYFELLGIPYVGPNVRAGVVGIDKVIMKNILRDANIPVTNFVWFLRSEYFEDKENIIERVKELNFPVIIKPASLGSSVGISKAKDLIELEESIDEAVQYDRKIIVEEMVNNLLEVNCSVIGDIDEQEASVIEEVMANDEFLSYKDKYMSSNTKGSKGMASTNRIIPARIDDEQTNYIQKIAKDTFRVLHGSGVSRIDFLIDRNTKNVYVNEINTIPGSLSFYLWEPTGKDFTQLTEDLIRIAFKRHRISEQLTFTYDTNILENFSGSKGVKK